MGLSVQCFVLSLLTGYKTVPDEDPGLPRTTIQLRAINRKKKNQPKPKLSQLCPFKVNTKKTLVKLTEGDDLLM